MKKKDIFLGIIEGIFIYCLIVALLAFFGAVFSGCKTNTVYVPVETVKTEYKEVIQRDSIHLYDSVFVKMKNDTVLMEKYKYLYRDKIIRDSIFVSDTIKVPYPIKGDTEYINKLHRWQKVLMIIGFLFVCFLGYKLFRLL